MSIQMPNESTGTTGQTGQTFPRGSPLIGDPPRESEGNEGNSGKIYAPEQWISYRITSTEREKIENCFKDYDALVAREISKQGEEHYHVIAVIDDKARETIKKRIALLELGRAKSWSKKNYKTFILGVSYTVKDGDYKTFGKYFTPELIAASKDAFNRMQKVKQEELKCKDTDRDWVLTFSNLVRVAQNYHKEHDMATTCLGDVLAHMQTHTRWIPSPHILRNGVDPYYHELFYQRVKRPAENGKLVNVSGARWWDREPENPALKKQRTV